jgi:hypothetical protein
MKWTFDHSQLPVYVRVIVEGKANINDARALLDELVLSELWHPGMSVLVDISEMPPTGDDRFAIIQDLIQYFIERRQDIGKSCIATVRPRAEAYNYIRQFEYGIRLRGSEAIVRNFMNTGNAADWLTNHAGMCGADARQII